MDELYEYAYTRVISESRQTPQKRATAEGALAIARRARANKPLSLSRTEIHLDNVLAGESLPPERVRVFGLEADDVWQATTHAEWIRIEPSVDYFDLHMVPPEQLNRANVEVLRRRTGEAVIVRVRVLTSSLQMLLSNIFGDLGSAPAGVAQESSAASLWFTPSVRPEVEAPVDRGGAATLIDDPSSRPPVGTAVGRAKVASDRPATDDSTVDIGAAEAAKSSTTIRSAASAAPGAARVTEAVRAARATMANGANRGPRRARLAVAAIDPLSAATTSAVSMAGAGLMVAALYAITLIPWVQRSLALLTGTEIYPYLALPGTIAGLTFLITSTFNLVLGWHRIFTRRYFGTRITLSENVRSATRHSAPSRRARLAIVRTTRWGVVVAVTIVGTAPNWLAQIFPAQEGSVLPVVQWIIAAGLTAGAITLAYNVIARWRAVELVFAEIGLSTTDGHMRRARLRITRISTRPLLFLIALLSLTSAGVWLGLDATAVTGLMRTLFTGLEAAGIGGRILAVGIVVTIVPLLVGLLALAYNTHVRVTAGRGQVDLTLSELD